MLSNVKELFTSIMSGILIGMGCITFLSCDNKYIGAALFSLGLYTIIRFGFKLFTGKVGEIVFHTSSFDDFMSYAVSLAKMHLGNFLGIYSVATLFMLSRLGKFVGETALQTKAASMVAVKTADSPVSLVILGIGCGICMAIAAFGAKGGDETQASPKLSPISQPLLIVMPVMVFILCGFEHCIADMFYILVTSSSPIDFIKVVACATIGNTIGGILVGLAKRYV